MSYRSANRSEVTASAGPKLIRPALWMTTSSLPQSATIRSMPASTEASDWTSNSTARKSTPRSLA